MKYRGVRRNSDYISGPDRVRALTREQIEGAMKTVTRFGLILVAFGIKNEENNRRVLKKRCEDFGIHYSHLVTTLGKCRLKDLTGKQFGRLKVISRAPTTASGHTMWFCEELGTGTVKPVASTHLLRGNAKSFTPWKIGKEHAQWDGVEEMSGNYWNHIERGAMVRKLLFNISKTYAWNLFVKQNRKCALSGLDLYFPACGKSPYTASLDRIDSSKGYIEGNVQWVHKTINLMKNRLSQEEFISFCKSVAQCN